MGKKSLLDITGFKDFLTVKSALSPQSIYIYTNIIKRLPRKCAKKADINELNKFLKKHPRRN